MMELDTTIQGIGITTALDKDSFIKNAKSYIEAIIAYLDNRFPEAKTLTLLGYFDPRNVIQHSTTGATPLTMLELGEKLQVEGHKFWQEYIGYKSFVKSLPRPLCLDVAVHVMHSPMNKEAMTVAYPLISSILACIAVLPASSTQVERLFFCNEKGQICTEKPFKSKNS